MYTRSGGVWTQQGNKLVGTGAVENAEQGASVALSADGNTAIVGGPGDNWTPGRRGCTRAATGCGPSRAASWSAPARLGLPNKGVRRAVRRRQHRHRGRAWRQRGRRGGVGLHPQRRGLDPAGQQAGRHRRGWSCRQGGPSRCPPTATPPSWAGLATTGAMGRRGSLFSPPRDNDPGGVFSWPGRDTLCSWA